MHTLRPLQIRYLTIRRPFLLTGIQRRWARVYDVRYVGTQQNEDNILDRYKHKLAQKAKEHGFADVRELKDAYKDQINKVKATPASAPKDSPRSSSVATPPSQARQFERNSPSSPNRTTPGLKTLSSFLDIQKVLELPAREIESIWRLRHAPNKNSLCATIPLSSYRALSETAKRHPQFILPIPREGVGAEIHFLQWTFPAPNTVTVLFTHLAEYKLRGEFAQPHTTVTHHLELAEPKGLVLLEGSVIEGRGVTVDEGKWLLICMQKFYGQTNGEQVEKRRRLLEQFSHGDGTFKIEELVDEAEKIL